MTKKNQEKTPNHLLRQAREQRGWSQERLAQELEVSPQTVSRWECGTAFPYPHYREQLSLLFEKNIEALGLVQEKAHDRPEDISNQLPSETIAVPSTIQRLLPYDQAHEENGLPQKDVAQNRRRMLGRLRHAYAKLLDHSLQETAWIELGLVGMPNAVQNATNRLARLSQQNDHTLPPGTSILEVYERSGGDLLILGEAGAGKSTMLLRLAHALVQRAEQEETYPLPVILRLSSWTGQHPTLDDWMIDQLALTYDISHRN